jgi:hypothetical protein
MSARMQLETLKWAEVVTNPEQLVEIEMQSRLRNLDHRNLVAPLREAQLGMGAYDSNGTPAAEQRRAALALQQQWDAWLCEREVLRGDIKRGRECLEHTQNELAGLRANLEDWVGYERICGRSPLLEYMQLLSAKERIEQFLPEWLKRREAQLHALNNHMEQCAKQNGLEHLL